MKIKFRTFVFFYLLKPENPCNHYGYRGFFIVAEIGLGPATSGLWAAAEAAIRRSRGPLALIWSELCAICSTVFVV